MKTTPVLVCCIVLGTALAGCKGKTSAPAESEPKAAAPADGESQAAARPGQPITIVRQVGVAPVEVDTSAPANVAAVPEDSERSESGLAWVVLKEGAGKAHPAEGDIAVMNFIGWTAGGELVQESLTRGGPGAIAIRSMFPGLAEGVQSMVAGEKRRFWIPGNLAFGEATPGEPPAKEGPPLGMLVYEVELLRFETPPPKPGDLQVSE
jgi:peptidylprolyl isomerase